MICPLKICTTFYIGLSIATSNIEQFSITLYRQIIDEHRAIVIKTRHHSINSNGISSNQVIHNFITANPVRLALKTFLGISVDSHPIPLTEYTFWKFGGCADIVNIDGEGNFSIKEIRFIEQF